MKKNQTEFLKTIFKSLFSMFLTAVISMSSYAQSLTTDLPDYPPGATVTITGSGFTASETVSVQVLHNPTCCDDATSPDHLPWNVSADGNGDFVTTWVVPPDQDELGANLIATATGQTSNFIASATFTDALTLSTVIPSNSGVQSLTCGGTMFFKVHVNTTGQTPPSAAVGLAVTWTATNGTMSSASAVTDANGDAIGTYNHNGTTTSGSVNVSVAGTNPSSHNWNINISNPCPNCVNTTSDQFETACDSYTWANGNGNTYTSSGNYTYVTTITGGCTNTATLHLTINHKATISCPPPGNIGSCNNQADVDAAFLNWLATASISNDGGCTATISNDGGTSGPLACGGSTLVTFSATNCCGSETCSATFTVEAAPEVLLVCPVATTSAACLSQSAIETAYNNWLASVSATGGCNTSISNVHDAAPDKCTGGTATAIFTASSTCQGDVTCSSTFTVPASSLSATASTTNNFLFYGYNGDQTSPGTVVATGGCSPYSYSWTMNRPLSCNVSNSSGDESFSGGSCVNTCDGNTTPNSTTGSAPVCTGSSTIVGKFMNDADITASVTDANGCVASSSYHVDAIDARCFAGNSGVAKVTMCHHTGSIKNPYVTICVDQSAVAALIAQGDCVGPCGSGNPCTRIADGGLSNTSIVIYPNPTDGLTSIKFYANTDDKATVNVYNVTGTFITNLLDGSVSTGNEYQVTFDANTVTAGVYFIKLTIGSESTMQKIVVYKK